MKQDRKQNMVNVDKDMEKLEPSSMACGNKLAHLLCKTVWYFFNNLNTELLNDSAISLLGVCSQRIENRCSNKNSRVNVHSSSI